MSLPFSKFVPISAKVQSPAFAVEKKHALLATTSDLFGTNTPYKEYSGSAALTNIAADFGKNSNELKFARKYFNFQSKTGTAPEKLVTARWYKTASAPFIKCGKPGTLAELTALSDASFDITLDEASFTVLADLTSATSYADIATALQTEIQSNTAGGAAFTGATVEYSTITNGFIIRGGTTGRGKTIAVSASSSGTDALALLGLAGVEPSEGADAESFAEFCDRILNTNTAGYSITTLEILTNADIKAAIEWLQGSVAGQTINTVVRLVFAISDKIQVKELQTDEKELGYTGYVAIYDPYGEYVNALDCAICASTDYEAVNGSLNFNFQPASGYTAITKLGDVVNYQAGITNLSATQELDDLCISYVYSVGFGTQEQVLYGLGLQLGAFGTEDIQVNESALQTDLQVAIVNGFVSLNKIKLQGSDAKGFIATLIAPVLDKYKANGSIAYDGKLSDSDKNAVFQATANAGAADSIESNGYYFQVQDLTAEDIRLRRVRVVICYLAGGVVNQIRIVDNIFGA